MKEESTNENKKISVNDVILKDKRILDVTCGGRSIWFNKRHPLALFCDRRDVEYEQVFGKEQPSTRHIKVHPDLIADFTDLPFEDNTFNLVVFDPPHIVSPEGNNRWFTKAYGHYKSEEEAIKSVHDGIHECMRVLKPYGVLIFKWAETSIPTPTIIKEVGYEPLFGHRSGKKSGTNWLTFMKEESPYVDLFT